MYFRNRNESDYLYRCLTSIFEQGPFKIYFGKIGLFLTKTHFYICYLGTSINHSNKTPPDLILERKLTFILAMVAIIVRKQITHFLSSEVMYKRWIKKHDWLKAHKRHIWQAYERHIKQGVLTKMRLHFHNIVVVLE